MANARQIDFRQGRTCFHAVMIPILEKMPIEEFSILLFWKKRPFWAPWTQKTPSAD
jgi:hypothetical protein